MDPFTLALEFLQKKNFGQAESYLLIALDNQEISSSHKISILEKLKLIYEMGGHHDAHFDICIDLINLKIDEMKYADALDLISLIENHKSLTHLKVLKLKNICLEGLHKIHDLKVNYIELIFEFLVNNKILAARKYCIKAIQVFPKTIHFKILKYITDLKFGFVENELDSYTNLKIESDQSKKHKGVLDSLIADLLISRDYVTSSSKLLKVNELRRVLDERTPYQRLDRRSLLRILAEVSIINYDDRKLIQLAYDVAQLLSLSKLALEIKQYAEGTGVYLKEPEFQNPYTHNEVAEVEVEEIEYYEVEKEKEILDERIIIRILKNSELNWIMDNYKDLYASMKSFRFYKAAAWILNYTDKFYTGDDDGLIEIKYLYVDNLIDREKYFKVVDVVEELMTDHELSPDSLMAFVYLQAECLRKLNKLRSAKSKYQFIVNNFGDFRLARERLAEID